MEVVALFNKMVLRFKDFGDKIYLLLDLKYLFVNKINNYYFQKLDLFKDLLIK